MRKNQKEDSLLPVYKWALSYLKPYWLSFFAIVLFEMASSGIELLIPKLVQTFIDRIIPEKLTELFKWGLIGLALCVTALLAIDAISNMWRRKMQEKIARDVQYDIFRHFRSLGFAYFEKHPIGESLSLMNSEVGSLQGLYRDFLPSMLHSFLFSSISVVFMLSINIKLALVMIPGILLYYIFGPYFDRKATHLAKENAEANIRFNRKAYETIVSQQEIRAFSAQQWDRKKFNEATFHSYDVMTKAFWYNNWRVAVRRLSYYAGGMAAIIYGVHLIRIEELAVGAFVAFLLYYFQAMNVITYMISTIVEQKVLMVRAGKLHSFLQQKPEVDEHPDPVRLRAVRGDIRFRQVSFRYGDGPVVLDKLDLSIGAGERVALVGTSGNGKSTMLKLLVRFYDVDAGEIEIDGVPIRKLSFEQLRDSIGFVFQETYLFGSSVKDNIRFGKPEATDEEIVEAARAAYAHDFIMALPQGYDTPVGERGVKLSGGQRQRISIARMFVKNPAIVLLDEATSSLDNLSEKEVQMALDRLLVGRTTLTIAHRLSTVKDYDRLALIERGQVLEAGPYQQLLDKRGAFYRLSEGERQAAEEVAHG